MIEILMWTDEANATSKYGSWKYIAQIISEPLAQCLVINFHIPVISVGLIVGLIIDHNIFVSDGRLWTVIGLVNKSALEFLSCWEYNSSFQQISSVLLRHLPMLVYVVERHRKDARCEITGYIW